MFPQVTRLCALSDGRRVLSSVYGSDSLRVWDAETGRECEERSTRGFSDIFLDGHTLSADLFLDLPFSQVWAAHSLVVICHKIGDQILIPPPTGAKMILHTAPTIAPTDTGTVSDPASLIPDTFVNDLTLCSLRLVIPLLFFVIAKSR
jgi:hypothetical protein